MDEQCFREQKLKWNGWGYKDSFFSLDEHKEVQFTGERYGMHGKVLPHFTTWMCDTMGIDRDYFTKPQLSLDVSGIPGPFINDRILDCLKSARMDFSTDRQLCMHRSHGHSMHDMFVLRGKATFKRIADLIVWPRNQAEVVQIVKLANETNCCIIPIGGGTSVTNALECPEEEQRTIISLDLTKMNKILWTDSDTLCARAEAGIIGQDLEQGLNEKGFTLGHEPDSVEFSSLGGWVATRASGMKKNKYGNMEDLLINASLVTSKGILEKNTMAPRISAGPDLNHVILGSEGTLGVITEVTFKIWPLPEVKRYGSILFTSFEDGVKFMREVALKRCAPASIRLVDNEQFVLGQALKPAAASLLQSLTDKLKKLYVTKWLGYEPDAIVAATLVFEGTAKEVADHEQLINAIAVKHNGLPAGAENGRYGYMLTFAIAYIRDFGLDFSCLGESFETSVPWDRVLTLCKNVKEYLHCQKVEKGIKYPIFASCRVTQVYDTGACVYFYFAFNYRGVDRPLEVYEAIEEGARDHILFSGGSISHHHGIGKIRQRWYPMTVGATGTSLYLAIKRELDPNNVFGCQNLHRVSKL